jgi:hypothetical protein
MSCAAWAARACAAFALVGIHGSKLPNSLTAWFKVPPDALPPRSWTIFEGALVVLELAVVATGTDVVALGKDVVGLGCTADGSVFESPHPATRETARITVAAHANLFSALHVMAAP